MRSRARAGLYRTPRAIMTDFNVAIVLTLKREGVVFDARGVPVPGRTGYNNDPDDPGGETNYGITKAVAIANGYMGPMIDIPYEIVLNIYKKIFWDINRLGDLASQAVANEVFDTGVLAGPRTAGAMLQRALNVLNKGATLWPDVARIGAIDRITIAAANKCVMIPNGDRAILELLNAYLGEHLTTNTERNPKLEKYIWGWIAKRMGVLNPA